MRAEIDDVNKSFKLRLDSGKLVESTGGKLGADIEMYENEIPKMKERLDEVASTLVNEFNAIHSSGFGLEDGNSRNFFDPSFTDAASIKVNDDIRANVAHIAASSVDGEAGNGDAASQLADLRNENVIGGRKLVDYSVDLISTPGRNLSEVRSSMEVRDSEISMLTAQQEREAGVNVDEELSMMIQYQNAYQGAARVMSAAQQMYDTLIGLTR